MIWRTGIKFYTLEFSNLLQLLNNQLCQVYSVSFFERMIKVELKMVYINYQKLVFLVILSFHIIIKGPGTSFQSPALSRKHVCYKIHLNLILTILSRCGSRGWTSGTGLGGGGGGGGLDQREESHPPPHPKIEHLNF